MKSFVKISQLLNRVGKKNLADELDKDLLGKIAGRCLEDLREDETSREEWMKNSTIAIEHAMQISQAKTFPWVDCANVKYPQLTIAALQFHARAYPSIVRGNNVVKCVVTGEDQEGLKAEKAKRISTFMSWQCLESIDDWEDDLDQLLLTLPILGCIFKETYFDFGRKKICSGLVYPQDLVINYKLRKMGNATRITKLFTLSPQAIIERQMQGVYLKEDIAYGDKEGETEQEMFAQHCLIDLDEDGYKEPYIVTIHRQSGTLLRIVANYAKDTIYVNDGDQAVTVEAIENLGESDVDKYNLAYIKPVEYFTRFQFIPSPDGGIYGIGFGQLLMPMIGTIDTSINQLLDAGTLQNTGGGLMAKGLLTDKKGDMTFKPGEYKIVDNLTGASIRDAIYRFEQPGPSGVTYSMLDKLIQVTRDITTVQDIMVGSETGEETATTTLSRVDQGMKLFTAIYKRIYRSLKAEFVKIKRLNKYHLPASQYYRVLDSGIIEKIGLEDFKDDETDVQPVSDPSLSSLPLKLAKAQALRQAAAGNPFYNQREVEKRYLEALEEPNIDAVLLKEEDVQTPPDPKMIEVDGKLQKITAEIESMKLDRIKTVSEVLLNIAKAEAQEQGSQLEAYKLQLDTLLQKYSKDFEGDRDEMPVEQRRGVPLEEQPIDEQGLEGGAGLPAELAGGFGEGEIPDTEQPGADGLGDGANRWDM